MLPGIRPNSNIAFWRYVIWYNMSNVDIEQDPTFYFVIMGEEYHQQFQPHLISINSCKPLDHQLSQIHFLAVENDTF